MIGGAYLDAGFTGFTINNSVYRATNQIAVLGELRGLVIAQKPMPKPLSRGEVTGEPIRRLNEPILRAVRPEARTAAYRIGDGLRAAEESDV